MDWSHTARSQVLKIRLPILPHPPRSHPHRETGVVTCVSQRRWGPGVVVGGASQPRNRERWKSATKSSPPPSARVRRPLLLPKPDRRKCEKEAARARVVGYAVRARAASVQESGSSAREASAAERVARAGGRASHPRQAAAQRWGEVQSPEVGKRVGGRALYRW